MTNFELNTLQTLLEMSSKELKQMCNSELLEWYTHYAQFIDYNDKEKIRMYDYFKRAVLERMKGE